MGLIPEERDTERKRARTKLEPDLSLSAVGLTPVTT
jgi:hypothetical protein